MADPKPAVPGLNQTAATGAGTPMENFAKKHGIKMKPVAAENVTLPSGTVVQSPNRTPMEKFLATSPGLVSELGRQEEQRKRGSLKYVWDQFTSDAVAGLDDVENARALAMADGPERIQMLALLAEMDDRREKLAALDRPEGIGAATDAAAMLFGTLGRSLLPSVGGGVSGGAAGAGAGALAGSVIPGAGTAAGAGVGWVAGAASGAAAAAGLQSYSQTAIQLAKELKAKNPEMTWDEAAALADEQAQRQGWETAALTGGAALVTAGAGAVAGPLLGTAAKAGPKITRSIAKLLREGPRFVTTTAEIAGRQLIEGASEGIDQRLQNEKAQNVGLDRGDWDDVGTAFTLGALADITPQVIFGPAGMIKNKLTYGSWFKPDLNASPRGNESPAPNDEPKPEGPAPQLALPAPDKPAGLLAAPSRERDHTIWATQQMQYLRERYEAQQKLDPRYADENISKAIYTLNYLMNGWEQKRALDAETDLAIRNSPEFAAKLNEVNDRLNLLDILQKPMRDMTVQRWYWRSNKLNSKRAGEKARNAEVLHVQTDAKGNPIIDINKKTGARFVRLKNGDTRSLKVGELFDVADPSPMNMLLSPHGRQLAARVARQMEAEANAENAAAQTEAANEAERAQAIQEAKNKAAAKMAAENMIEGNRALPAPAEQKALPAPSTVYGDGFTMQDSWPDQSPETLAALERAGFVDILEKGAERLGDDDLERVAIAARKMLEAGDTVTADKLVEFIENETKAEEAATKAKQSIQDRMKLLAEARKITASSDNLVDASVLDGVTRQRIAISRHRMGLNEKTVYTREEMRDMGFSDSDIDALIEKAGNDVSAVQRRLSKQGDQALNDAELTELYGTPREFVASIKDKRLRKAMSAVLNIYARVRGLDMDKVSIFELNKAFLNRTVGSGDSAAFRPEAWINMMTGKVGKAAIGIRSGKMDQSLILDIAHEMMHFTLRALGYDRKHLQSLWRAIKDSDDPVVKMLLSDKVYQAQFAKFATTKGMDVAEAFMGEEFLAETVAKVIGGKYVDRYYRRGDESRVAFVIRRAIAYLREIFQPMVGQDAINDLLTEIAKATTLTPAQIIAFDDSPLMARNYGDGNPDELLPDRDAMTEVDDLFGDNDPNQMVGYSFVRPEDIEAAKAARVSVSAEEQAIIKRASELNGVEVKKITDALKGLKAQFPQSKGWAPMVLKKLEFGEGRSGQRVVRPVFQAVPWTFHLPAGEQRVVKGPARDRHARMLADRMTKEVVEVFARASATPNTDEDARLAHNAQVILKNIGWYRGVAKRLNISLGSMSQLFADILGATSPQQAVPINFDHALEILQRFTSGEFDPLLDQYAAYLDAGGKPSAWTGGYIVRPNGEKYGINGMNALNALVDTYRDMKPGNSPKARNFAGNLGGTNFGATIDRWAARTLQRLAKKLRLPPMVAPGVGGAVGTKGDVGGAFGFGQEVFKAAADKLNQQQIGGLTWTPADLQALMWFVEKEHWMENGWADKGGDGGSFEQQLDEKLRADVIIGGISQAQPEKPLGIPAADQKQMSDRLMSAVSDDPRVVAYQATTTEGLFSEGDSVSQRETSFNLEVAVREGFTLRGLLRRMAVEAKRAGQSSFMLSKPVSPDVDHPNIRPQLTMYFTKPLTRAQVAEVITEYQKSHPYTGFTLLTDYRNRRGDGSMPATFIGLRSQYVPEFDPNGPALLEGDAAAFQQHMREQFNAYHKMAGLISQGGMAMQRVASAQLNAVDTVVYHEGDYDAIIAGLLGDAEPISIGRGFSSGSTFEQLARYHRTKPKPGQPVGGTDGNLGTGDEPLARREDGAIEGSGAATGVRWIGPRSGLNFKDLFDKAADVEGQRLVYNHLGVETDETVDASRLKIYPLQNVFSPPRRTNEDDASYNTRAEQFAEGKVNSWVNKLGWNYRIFGPDAQGNGWTPPDFRSHNYDNKTVWIYQPREKHGSFHDYAYTLPWRVTHEVAHGLVNEQMSDAWGGVGKRQGAIGRVTTHPSGKGEVKPLSLADGLRAVDWEFTTFAKQRELLEELGVKMTPLQYYQECIVNASDAVFRVLTGGFGDPVTAGILPPKMPATFAEQYAQSRSAEHRMLIVEEAIEDFRARAFDMLRDSAAYHGIPTYERLDADTGKVPSAAHLGVLDTTDAFWKFFKQSQAADDFGMPLMAFHGTMSASLDGFDPTKSSQKNLYGPAAGYFTLSGDIGSEYSLSKLSRYKRTTSFDSEEQFTKFMNDGDGANGYVYRMSRSGESINVTYLPESVVAQAAAAGHAPNVIPVYLSVQNAFDIDKAFSWAEIEDIFDQEPVLKIVRDVLPDIDSLADLIEETLSRTERGAEKVANPSAPLEWKPTDRSVNRLVLGDWLYEAIRTAMQRTGLDVGPARELTNDILATAGFDGITHIGGRLLGGGSKEHKVFIVFKPNAIKSMFNGGDYDPAFDDIMMRREEEAAAPDLTIGEASEFDLAMRRSMGTTVRSALSPTAEGSAVERLANWHARWNSYHTSTAARIRGITRTKTGYKIANMFDRDKFSRVSPTEKGIIAEDYHSALSGARGKFMPELTRILGSIAPGKERALAGVLRGEYGRAPNGNALIPASTGITVQQAREARAWLNGMYEYLSQAFRDAGETPPAYLRNYFPQWYDVENGVVFDKSARRPLQGIEKVAALREFFVQAFLPQPEFDVRGNRVYNPQAARLDLVRERVDKVIDKITNEGGIPMWGFDPMNELGKRTYNLTQAELQRMIHLDPGRMIPVKIGGRVIEMRLSDFLHNDTITTLNKYAVSATRRAEFIRRFGSDGKKLNEMLEAVDVERAEMNLPPLTIAERRTIIKDAQANVGLLGRRHIIEHPRIYKAQEIVKILGNLVMLNLSAISSLPEFFAPFTRMGVGAQIAAFQQNIRSVLHIPGALSAATRAARNAQPGDKFRQFRLAYNMSNSEMRQFAVDIGIIHEHMQYTLQGGMEDLEHTWIGKLNHIYFKYGNLLTPLTEMQQVGATAAAVRSIAAWGRSTSPKTERFLREIGLTRDEARAFNANDITSASDKVKAAIRQMVGETIVNPTSGKKPAWMSDPRWMLFAHIKSYITGFNNTVLQRSIREATLGNPVPLMGVGLAAFLAALLYELREWMRWGEEGNPYYARLGLKKDDPRRFALQMVDRGGLWGPAEPVASMIYGAKTGNAGSIAGAMVPTLSMADRAVSGVSNLVIAAATGDGKYYRAGVDNLTRVMPVVNALGQYRVDLVTDITGVKPKND